MAQSQRLILREITAEKREEGNQPFKNGEAVFLIHIKFKQRRYAFGVWEEELMKKKPKVKGFAYRGYNATRGEVQDYLFGVRAVWLSRDYS